MSAIGLDIGNESCVIAVAKRGGVDILLNGESKRETPAVVSFVEKQRFFGSAGAALATANPKSTISQIKRLIGKLYKEVEEELKLLPLVTSEGSRGEILIELEYLKRKWTFMPVEILGMLFKHLKQITEKNLESSVVDCVIGIPAYFSDLQRRLYLDAAVIAGLNPLRLMHDGTAIALGYGMYKTDFSDSGPTNIVFVDIGHCDTQVTVAAFKQGRMKILAHTFDPNLGGRDFDEVLFKHFASQFNEKYKIDVPSNARASTRLRASCEKVKKVLSANAEAPLSIECLIGDTDVKGFITREEFEKLSSKLLERVTVPCSTALKDSGLSVDEIYTLELVGSGSRIPAITRMLTLLFKKEPTRTLNASECVARGCALRCAMLSPAIQVRDYEVVDSFPYSIVIPSPQREVAVFKKGSPFPNQKIRNRTTSIPFYLQAAYIKDRDFPAGISHIVGSFWIGPSEPLDAENTEARFTVKLNHDGIVEISSAIIVEDNRSSASSAYSIWNWKLVANTNSDIVNLPITENLDVSTTKEELREAKAKENMLAEQDMKVEEIKDQRNTLESYVYETRSKLSSTYKRFAKDSEKEMIIKFLQETEDWLYEDSDDEYEQDYTGKLAHLKKLLEPVENRYEEDNAITNATKTFQACIAKYRSGADSLPAEKKEKVKDVCIKAEQWLNGFSQKQLSPKSMLHGINQKIEIVESKCKSIIKSKPSFRRHEEPVYSNHRYRAEELDQVDQPADSEYAITKAIETLQACCEKYLLLAESLPAEKKERVKDACNKAELWLNGLSSKRFSPKTILRAINHHIEIVESTYESIIRSKPSPRRHGETVDLDQRFRAEEPDQVDQPMDSENAITKAAKTLQTCCEHYLLLAESQPADKKKTVKDVCIEAERRINVLYQKHTSLKTLLHDINHVIEVVESKCESIIGSNPPFLRHEQPVYSDQRYQPEEQDHINRPIDSENDLEKARKALQTCIEKYLSLAESLRADKKEKVRHVCISMQNWIDDLFHARLAPHSLTAHIYHAIEVIESNCERIIGPKPSSGKHEEPAGSDQVDQPMDVDDVD